MPYQQIKKRLKIKYLNQNIMELKYFEETNLLQQKIIMRVDYNVPIKDGQIMDNTRILESLTTIKKLLENQATIVLMSHLGRPEGKKDLSLSLAPIAKELEKILQKPIKFIPDCQGQEVEQQCQNLLPGEIALLENLRFYPEEEANNAQFAANLAKLGQIYINDAFGTAHRAHASTFGITKFLPSYAGSLIQKEIKNLSLLFDLEKHPYSLVIGGAKIDTKIDIINNFVSRADQFFFGGGIANTFLAAQGKNLGSSLVETNKIETAKEIIKELKNYQKSIFLPNDFIVANEISNQSITENIKAEIKADQKILDLGKSTQIEFAEALEKSQIIVWNGPMGVYEYTPFRNGTKAIAEAIIKATNNGAISILGGGDTIDALKILGLSSDQFTHVSTGGGAMLEFLEKGTLPGLEVLKK